MSDRDRLATAIQTISERYLPSVVRANDSAGTLHWALRLADYSTRLAALLSPPAAPVTDPAVTAPDALSRDPQVAIAQLLAAIGHPLTVIAGSSVSIDPADIVRDASPEQNQQLALLGVLGVPGSYPGVDYSLFEQFYERDGDNWQPKAAYAVKGTWQSYLSGGSQS